MTGVPGRRAAHHAAHGNGDAWDRLFVDSAHVREWLAGYRGDWTTMAEHTGLTTRTIRRYRRGDTAAVPFGNADRIATFLGLATPTPTHRIGQRFRRELIA